MSSDRPAIPPQGKIIVTNAMIRAATRVLWESGRLPFGSESDADELLVRHMLETAIAYRND